MLLWTYPVKDSFICIYLHTSVYVLKNRVSVYTQQTGLNSKCSFKLLCQDNTEFALDGSCLPWLPLSVTHTPSSAGTAVCLTLELLSLPHTRCSTGPVGSRSPTTSKISQRFAKKNNKQNLLQTCTRRAVRGPGQSC